MTRYYDYIEAGAIVDDTSKFYLVALGSSVQGRRDYLFLMAYSVQHGHYFELHDARSAGFTERLRRSVPAIAHNISHVRGRDLVRYFKGAGVPTLSDALLANTDYQLRALNANYRIISNLNRRKASHC